MGLQDDVQAALQEAAQRARQQTERPLSPATQLGNPSQSPSGTDSRELAGVIVLLETHAAQLLRIAAEVDKLGASGGGGADNG